jgi:hypothetical protein
LRFIVSLVYRFHQAVGQMLCLGSGGTKLFAQLLVRPLRFLER